MSASRNSFVILRAIYIAAWILVAAFLALAVIPAPWDGLGGRDFRPQGFSLSIILLGSGMVTRYRLRWPWLSIFLGLLVVELLALLIIGYFSGSVGTMLFTGFNLRSLAYVNLFIGAPWLIGASLGEATFRYRHRASRV